MTETLWQHESNEETTSSSETMKSPDIEFLLEGTWSYIVDIYWKDINRQQNPLSAVETQKRINLALMKVNAQWGKLIKILELEVEWEKWVGMGRPPLQKVFMFVVDKEK